MKLGDHKQSKVTELDFSGRFSFAQKRAKRVKNSLKITFLIISQNRAISFSDFFCMKLGYHKHSKVIPEKCRLFNKGPKMDCFDNFSKWPKSESHIFSDIFMKLRVHKGSKVTVGINITQRG